MKKKEIENKIFVETLVINSNLLEKEAFDIPSFDKFKEANNLKTEENNKMKTYSTKRVIGLVSSFSVISLVFISLFSFISNIINKNNIFFEDSSNPTYVPENKGVVSDIELDRNLLVLNFNDLKKETNDNLFGTIKVDNSFYNYTNKIYQKNFINFKYNINSSDLSYLNGKNKIYFFTSNTLFIEFYI